MYGKNHSDDTRTKMSAALSGPNNPMYGAIAVNAQAVSVYNFDGVLVQQFSSHLEASK
jgi:hypothetical protein